MSVWICCERKARTKFELPLFISSKNKFSRNGHSLDVFHLQNVKYKMAALRKHFYPKCWTICLLFTHSHTCTDARELQYHARCWPVYRERFEVWCFVLKTLWHVDRRSWRLNNQLYHKWMAVYNSCHNVINEFIFSHGMQWEWQHKQILMISAFSIDQTRGHIAKGSHQTQYPLPCLHSNSWVFSSCYSYIILCSHLLQAHPSFWSQLHICRILGLKLVQPWCYCHDKICPQT